MTTYYVDSAATGTADGLSEANAWTTIDTAMNNVAAGDKVWVKASATYNEQATIDTVGTFSAPIEFEGYTTTTGDNGKVTMDGTTYCIFSTNSLDYYIFRNFKFINATSDNISVLDRIKFINCEITGAGAHGVDADDNLYFVNCIIANNTLDGINMSGPPWAFGCLFYGNGSEAVWCTTNGGFYKNVFYNNGGTVPTCQITSTFFIGNTVDHDNGSDSVIDESKNTPIYLDNVIYDSGGYGVDFLAVIQADATVVGHNLVNGHTSGAYSDSGLDIGFSDVTSAPAFTDEANDDYRPSSSSPAVDAQLKPGGIT